MKSFPSLLSVFNEAVNNRYVYSLPWSDLYADTPLPFGTVCIEITFLLNDEIPTSYPAVPLKLIANFKVLLGGVFPLASEEQVYLGEDDSRFHYQLEQILYQARETLRAIDWCIFEFLDTIDAATPSLTS